MAEEREMRGAEQHSAEVRQRLAVVSGAGRGFGEALVREFSAAGWLVLAVVRQASHAAVLDALPGVQAVVHDVRSDDVAGVVDAVRGHPVDVLINNAAQGVPHRPLGSVDAGGVLNAVDVNVAGPLRMVQALLPQLLAADHPVIINVTSRLGSLSAQARGAFTGLSTSYAYRVSKAAQNMLTVSLAQDLQGQVPCWAVHPGKLATGMGQSDAAKAPSVAAQELLLLLESGDAASPRYVSLGAADLDW
jgi:NAD(P)-dependent dehydrogenase (short-subunit alcohol dehydrogenase family)